MRAARVVRRRPRAHVVPQVRRRVLPLTLLVQRPVRVGEGVLGIGPPDRPVARRAESVQVVHHPVGLPPLPVLLLVVVRRPRRRRRLRGPDIGCGIQAHRPVVSVLPVVLRALSELLIYLPGHGKRPHGALRVRVQAKGPVMTRHALLPTPVVFPVVGLRTVVGGPVAEPRIEDPVFPRPVAVTRQI